MFDSSILFKIEEVFYDEFFKSMFIGMECLYGFWFDGDYCSFEVHRLDMTTVRMAKEW